ncbi:MAG: hypothetical protein ACK476_15190 [Fluviicola sp.]
MEERDYLKKQIDQMGQVFAKMLSSLLGLKNNGQVNEGLEMSNQTLKKELDFTIQELIDLPTDELIEYLTVQKNLTNENLDKLSEILLFHAENSQVEKEKLYKRCLMIYEYLDSVESIYSLERQWKIQRIKNQL